MKELHGISFSDLTNKFDQTGNGLYNFLTFGMLLIMFFSLVFDRYSRKNNEKLERKAYWFRTHIVKNKFSHVNSFFNNVRRKRNLLNASKITRAQYAKSIKNLTYKLTSDLKFLRYFDITLFEHVRDHIASFEELIITNTSFSDDESRQYKDDLLKTLFEYEINGYKIKKNYLNL